MRNRWEDKGGEVDEPVTITEKELRALKRGASVGMFALILSLVAVGAAGGPGRRGHRDGAARLDRSGGHADRELDASRRDGAAQHADASRAPYREGGECRVRRPQPLRTGDRLAQQEPRAQDGELRPVARSTFRRRTDPDADRSDGAGQERVTGYELTPLERESTRSNRYPDAAAGRRRGRCPRSDSRECIRWAVAHSRSCPEGRPPGPRPRARAYR